MKSGNVAAGNYWHGKVALVTGSSGGLGRAIAAAFAAAGARVVLAAREPQALQTAAAELEVAGSDVLAVQADVTDGESVDALFARAVDHYGRLDVLVNNAGRSTRKAAIDATPEDFQALLDLNLLGVVRCTRAAMPQLLAHRGHLVNISSLAGRAAARYLGAYPASKFAVTAYTQQLRLELSERGLHVLLVCPGPIARDAPRSQAREGERAAPEDLVALPESARKPGGGVKTRALRPERVAAAIVRACERRQAELVFPPAARLVFALMQLSPTLGDYLVRRLT